MSKAIGSTLEDHSKPPKKPFFSCLGCFLAGSLLTILVAILLPGFIRPSGQGHLTACKSNLKNLAIALEMYASDNKEAYPRKLSDVLPGKYLQQIPSCPACGEDTYSPSYQAKGTRFTLFCRGDNHAKALAGPNTQNQPAYPMPEDHP